MSEFTAAMARTISAAANKPKDELEPRDIVMYELIITQIKRDASGQFCPNQSRFHLLFSSDVKNKLTSGGFLVTETTANTGIFTTVTWGAQG